MGSRVPKPARAKALGTSEWVPYVNANKAAEALKLRSSQVYKCLKGERTHVGGYQFEIDTDADPQRVCKIGKRRPHEVIVYTRGLFLLRAKIPPAGLEPAATVVM